MKRFKAWLGESILRPMILGAGLVIAGIVLLLVIAATVSSIQTEANQAKADAAAKREAYQSQPDVSYTEPPPIVSLSDFYSKNHQTRESRELNHELYALTDTIVAPNKPTTVKGVNAVAWGSFGDLCAVLVSHSKSDSSGTYNIAIYPYAGDTQNVSSKNALDIDPSNDTIAQDGVYSPSFTREHASIQGMNYVLAHALTQCSEHPESYPTLIPGQG